MRRFCCSRIARPSVAFIGGFVSSSCNDTTKGRGGREGEERERERREGGMERKEKMDGGFA